MGPLIIQPLTQFQVEFLQNQLEEEIRSVLTIFKTEEAARMKLEEEKASALICMIIVAS